MKTQPMRLGLAKLPGIAIGVLLMLAPICQMTAEDATEVPDPCEVEAMKAYRQALELCQLSESNPRLRCYEAAKAVYIQTLQSCRARH
jgi:hypothetical protein